ncbi:glucose-1-phosphate adenylyltransferase [Myxococcota bacterium]|nr:glucose-1-phosphate adenylyltransferase [Myxococcota bacterium]MBU1538080.1 glucose-1-phosphate adenylyltransferase [Myxococcota bacterium]
MRRRTSSNIVSMVLAGGMGSRLFPLTADRAKPAVPIGGRYRLIDIVLSNFVNSGLYKVNVITQYKSDSLNKHLSRGWHFPFTLGHYVEAVPAQQRVDKSWFKGSADAVYQSLNIIAEEKPDLLCIFGGDHIYTMDVRQMVDFHIMTGADLTIAAIPLPIAEASSFGVIEVDSDWRVIGFQEKPKTPKEIPGRPGWSLVSMGNYVFDPLPLVSELSRDAESTQTSHDFGKDIIPKMVETYRVYVYDFSTNWVPGQTERERGYWRDVGTIKSYFDANMDLVNVLPVFSLYNTKWPIHTFNNPLPPAKFIFSDGPRVGIATNSLVSEGCIISGGRIDRSILSPKVRINSYSQIEECILFEGVDIGRNVMLRRCIVDKGVRIPAGEEIGYDIERDKQRFVVTDEDIVVIPKGYVF